MVKRLGGLAWFLGVVWITSCGSSDHISVGNGGGAKDGGAPSSGGQANAGAAAAAQGGAGRGGAPGFGGASAGNGGLPAGGSGAGGLGAGGLSTGGSSAGRAGATNIAAGSSNGGAAGKGGGSSAGAGGAASVPFQCDPSDGSAVGTPNDCTAIDPNDSCQKCVQAKCCTQYAACYATDPGNQCGWGGPAKINGVANDGGEIACIQVCLVSAVAESGTAPSSSEVNSCASHCTTSLADGATKECGSTIGAQTSDLVGCLLGNCSSSCFGG